jgi:hypothetical protein
VSVLFDSATGDYVTILIDKSAFESFSHDEHRLLHTYFSFQVLPPVMLTEIVSDLVKQDASASSPDELVQRLARKFLGSGPAAHVPHAGLLRNDLLGDPITMNGSIYPQTARMVDHPVHGTGMVVDVPAMNEALFRWGYGEFLDEERDMAEAWKASIAPIPEGALEPLRARLRRARNLAEVGPVVDQALANRDFGAEWLDWLSQKARLSPRDRLLLSTRWLQERTDLRSFTPYGHHCMKADLALIAAMDAQAVPHLASNFIDVQYLYYVPFCTIFVSDDRVHKRLAPLLLREDQEFVQGTELKADLAARLKESRSLDGAAGERRSFAFGMYPVPMRDSVITHLTLKHAGIWPGRGNSITSLSPEDKARAIKEARSAFLRAGIDVNWRTPLPTPEDFAEGKHE